MPKPPYFGRALLDLLLLLPLLFQVVLIGAGIVAGLIAATGAPVFIGASIELLFIAVFLGHVGRVGRQKVIRAHAPLTQLVAGSPDVIPESTMSPDARLWVRYLPLVVVLSYTLTFALIGLFLTPPETGARFGSFIAVFSLTHLTSTLAIFFVTMMGVPHPGYYLAPPLAIYAAYALGMMLGFRRLGAPPTHRPGRVLAGTLLVAAFALMLWRSGDITRDFLSPSGDPRLSDQVLTYDYAPLSQDNKLVPVPDPGLAIASEHPRLDGATALYPVYAAAAQAIYQNVDERSLRPLVSVSTTPRAYERLIAGEVDLIFVAQPSTEQRAAAAAAGVELVLTPIGKEAFVFFVAADNPVVGLTTAQIRDIYTKRVTNWSALGGRDQPIIPFQRPPGSGSQTALELKVLAGEPPAPPLREEFARGMGGVIQQVAAYRHSSGAIGYSFRMFATVMSPVPDLRLLAIDGVPPTRETIRADAYPYTVEIYAATAGTTNPHVPALLAWFLQPAGQALLNASGYVSLAPAAPEEPLLAPAVE